MSFIISAETDKDSVSKPYSMINKGTNKYVFSARRLGMKETSMETTFRAVSAECVMAPENRTIFAGRGKLSDAERSGRIKDMFENMNIQTMMRKLINYDEEKDRGRKHGEPKYNLFDGNHRMDAYDGYKKGEFALILTTPQEKMNWFEGEYDPMRTPNGPVMVWGNDNARDKAYSAGVIGGHVTIATAAMDAIDDARVNMIELPHAMLTEEAYTRAEKANNCTPLLPAERMKIRRARGGEMCLKYRTITEDGLKDTHHKPRNDAVEPEKVNILQRILVDEFYKYQASFLVAIDKQSLTRRILENVAIITSVNTLDHVLETPHNSALTMTERQLEHISRTAVDIINKAMSRMEQESGTRFTLKHQHMLGIILVALELAVGNHKYAIGEDASFFTKPSHLGNLKSIAILRLGFRVQEAFDILRQLEYGDKTDKVSRIYHFFITGQWLTHEALITEKHEAKRQRTAL